MPAPKKPTQAEAKRARHAKAAEPTAAAAAPVPAQRQPFGLVHLMAIFTGLIGVALIVMAVAGGGGLGSYGVLIGAFFVAAGFMRYRLLRARSKVPR
jgi:fatty acid desaturase